MGTRSAAAAPCRRCTTRQRAVEVGLPNPDGPFTPAQWQQMYPPVEELSRYRPADEPEAVEAYELVEAAQSILDAATARWEAAIVALNDHDRGTATQDRVWIPWGLGRHVDPSATRRRLDTEVREAQRARDEAGQAWTDANARHGEIVRRLARQAMVDGRL